MSTMTSEQTPTFDLEIARPALSAPARARSWVTYLLEDTVPRNVLESAVLVASELTANAAVHGPADARILLGLKRTPAGLEISVHDQGHMPADAWQPSGDELAERGRGLILIRALAEVDVHTGPAGTTVSAVIPLAGAGA